MRSKISKILPPVLLVTIMLASVLVGCTNKQQGVEAPITKTVVDMAGRTVELPADVQNIITVYPPATALVFAVDGADHLVGIESLNANNEVLQDIEPKFKTMTNVGHQFQGVNVEEIMALEPDVVFASIRNREQSMQEFESYFPVVYIDVNTIEALNDSMLIVGQTLGKEARAQELVSHYEEKMENVLNIASQVPDGERPCVYMTSHSILSTCTAESIEDYILQVGGGMNAAIDAASGGTTGLYPEITVEQLITWNPDIIVVNSFCSADTKDEILSDPQLTDIKAVKNGQVFQMPDYISCWYIGVPESLLGMEWTLYILHPDIINFQIEEEIQDFYTEFYRLDMPSATVDELLGR